MSTTSAIHQDVDEECYIFKPSDVAVAPVNSRLLSSRNEAAVFAWFKMNKWTVPVWPDYSALTSWKLLSLSTVSAESKRMSFTNKICCSYSCEGAGWIRPDRLQVQYFSQITQLERPGVCGGCAEYTWTQLLALMKLGDENVTAIYKWELRWKELGVEDVVGQRLSYVVVVDKLETRAIAPMGWYADLASIHWSEEPRAV